MQLQHFFLLFAFLFLTTPCYSAKQPTPKILSALYGYDGCIGGVDNFSTEEEYLQELKRFANWSIVKMIQYSIQKELYCGGRAWGYRGEIV